MMQKTSKDIWTVDRMPESFALCVGENMKRKSVKEQTVSLALAGICMLTLFSGCGQQDGAVRGSAEEAPGPEACPHPDDWQEEAEDGSLPTEIPGGAYVSNEESDSDGADNEDIQPGDAEEKNDALQEMGEPAPAEEKQPDKAELDIPENGRRLTAEELAAYTEWIQDISNYGFLLSDWENPAQINLYEVFYNGAGVARGGTEEEKRAHMERNDQPEIYTDFIAMDKADVDAVLLEKVGLTYDELVVKGSRGMEDAYYAETDSFCLERGDTNYFPFVCKDGVINEEGTVVTLRFNGDDWVRTCEVKVNIATEPWHFLESHIVEGMVLDSEWYSEMQ